MQIFPREIHGKDICLFSLFLAVIRFICDTWVSLFSSYSLMWLLPGNCSTFELKPTSPQTVPQGGGLRKCCRRHFLVHVNNVEVWISYWLCLKKLDICCLCLCLAYALLLDENLLCQSIVSCWWSIWTTIFTPSLLCRLSQDWWRNSILLGWLEYFLRMRYFISKSQLFMLFLRI